MSVEGRTHRPVVNQEKCNSCSVCFRACPAELMVGLRKDEDNLCGMIYSENKREFSIASSLDKVTPPCQQACPINQDIRGYLQHIAFGRFEDALKVICETNPLPLVCGYVCHRPCESACIKKDLNQSVPIRALKHFVAENYDVIERWDAPPLNNGIKISIIGTGPAGLATASELAGKGYQVDMYESHSKPGGMLRWAIPDFRLPRVALQKEINRLEALGVKITTGVKFGDQLTFQELMESGSQAVILATGTMMGSSMNIINEQDVSGLIDCLDFFSKLARDEKMTLGQKVLVVGGGNAAVDTARMAMRLGPESVTILYRRSQAEMPAEKAEVEEAKIEGVKFQFLTLPVEVISQNGAVKGLKCMKTMLVEDPKSKRLKPMICADSEFEIEADTIISAVGQSPDFEQVFKGLPLKPDWNYKSQLSDVKSFKKIPGLFTTGDFSNGSSTVVEALASGKRTAMGVMDFLHKQKVDND